MKAAYIETTGPADVIRYGDLPDPTPAPTQVVVKTLAVSVNPIDTYIRSGVVKMPIPMPFIVGCDIAGEVESVGASVKRFKAGDRVWASNQGLLGRQGTFAERVAIEEGWLHPIPTGVDPKSAAAVALTGITAHLGLFRCANLKPGELVFINGGSGGVGSCVLQMSKAAGAKVITTAGSEEKLARCRDLGADLALNYKTTDVDAAVRQYAPQGVNLFWETQRVPNFERIIPLLARRGRIVLMAGRDARPVFPVGPFYTKDCSLHGFAMFNFSADEQASAGADINQWLSQGKLSANIGKTFALADAAAAHRLQEENTLQKTGTLTGKIVLVP